ncbi:ATP-binding cassette domain-containing protein [Niabella aurantiaca]|uniref:ATP-binding cassette domain-containing protein n=1 Tax=Niabella aurantiaca TaxID=379900 RepID=UPI001B7FB167|nr:ATP-binding cassette domain-containing protein [Niabella aurantiaca]
MPILNIKDLSVHYGSKTVLHNLSFTVNQGEGMVIRGESGSGKTTLAKAIAGQATYTGSLEISFDPRSSLHPKTHLVESWYRFTNLEGDRNFYYQQRYNHQQRRDTITIARELELYGRENVLAPRFLNELIAALDYSRVLDEQLFEISSGEHKKLQLIKALWLSPQLLMIDQPYTGLDTRSRARLNQLLNDYTTKGGTLILLSNDTELPACINHFVTLSNGQLIAGEASFNIPQKPLKPLPSFLKERPSYTTQNLISMKNASVRYDGVYVLSDINWEVNAGERWLLQGHNGSGKSTLLSLVTGDHPQAYANDMKLFGVQRGGGESIWDIKKRIGLISPELHWYFDASATVLQSLASGFFDSNGLYRQLRYAQKQQLDELLKFLELYDVRDELLTTLPLGKQRLALLGRTIIKNPQLLVLDEPCQGLDQQQTRYFNDLVDAISKNGVTIIYVGHFETQLPSCISHKLVLENGKTLYNQPVA